MPRQAGGSSGGETTPRFAETTPPVYRGKDYDFVLQGMYEIQKGIGKLEEAVGTLKEQSKQHGDKLEKISLRIYAATAVLVVLGTIIGFLLNKGVDLLIQLTGHH